MMEPEWCPSLSVPAGPGCVQVEALCGPVAAPHLAQVPEHDAAQEGKAAVQP